MLEKLLLILKYNSFENVPKKIKSEHLEALREHIDKQIQLLNKSKGRSR